LPCLTSRGQLNHGRVFNDVDHRQPTR
jgi:hypothetical protein